MRVGYDAQAFLASNGGLGKGAQLRTLLGPYVSQFVGFASNAPNRSGIPLVQEGASRYHLWQQFSLPSSLRRHRIELFLAPSNTAPSFIPHSIDLVLVLHDTILLKRFRRPGFRARMMDAYRRWQIPGSVARARVVVTVSQHAREEILQLFPRVEVRVIPCTLPARWFDPAPLHGREGYLLMVTSPAPHKNALGAIEGYAQYARRTGGQARPLKVVGLSSASDAVRGRLESLGVGHLVTVLPFVSESKLMGLYRNAAALLLPSFAEGFGIPMIEAMATGTPVIAARATSLPEVGGEAARYFDPHNTEDIAAALEKALTSESLLAEMAERGVERAQQYCPARVAQQVSAFWHEMEAV